MKSFGDLDEIEDDPENRQSLIPNSPNLKDIKKVNENTVMGNAAQMIRKELNIKHQVVESPGNLSKKRDSEEDYLDNFEDF